VAISRATPKRRCRFVAATGKLTRARSCRKPVWLAAKGTASWSFGAKRTLPRGAYAMRARARDRAGNVQAKPASRAARIR
jgi:hypothetical protein